MDGFNNLVLGSNEPVIVTKKSHIHQGIQPVLQAALSQIHANADFIKQTIEFPNTIGNTHCVKTTKDDVVYLKRRQGRKGLSRMVAKRQPEPSNKLTICLAKNLNGYYLITAFIGDSPEPEPWDENAFTRYNDYNQAKATSIAFWLTHALIQE